MSTKPAVAHTKVHQAETSSHVKPCTHGCSVGHLADSGPICNTEIAAQQACAPLCTAAFLHRRLREDHQLKKIVQAGRARMKKKRVIIAGLVRNGEATLQRMHCLMKQSVVGALDHRVIIFENDSNDKTCCILQRLCAMDNRTICLNSSLKGATNATSDPLGL